MTTILRTAACRRLLPSRWVLGSFRHHGSYESAGTYSPATQSLWAKRKWAQRAFTVGVGGPVGSGKTALLKSLCERLNPAMSLGVVTNDIFTREVRCPFASLGSVPARECNVEGWPGLPAPHAQHVLGFGRD